MFVPDKAFHPSLIFASKAGAWHYTQILSLAGKGCQGQNTLAYLASPVTKKKSFNNMTPTASQSQRAPGRRRDRSVARFVLILTQPLTLTPIKLSKIGWNLIQVFSSWILGDADAVAGLRMETASPTRRVDQVPDACFVGKNLNKHSSKIKCYAFYVVFKGKDTRI